LSLVIQSNTPLPVLFVQTNMPIGGAEMLLVNLVRKLDRKRFAPEVVCLKEPGPLGEELAQEIPLQSDFLASKYDLRVLPKLVNLMRQRKIGAVITVGAGDKMFWGRLAAKIAGVPVIGAALHSTGWPDGVGKLNRLLTPLTDVFIGVAKPHGEFLVNFERFPPNKVAVIPNGVDTTRFAPLPDVMEFRQSLGLGPTTPVVGILAALRPEKNHELFLQVARRVLEKLPEAQFLIIGDGPRRGELEALTAELKIADSIKFLGSRSDVPELLATLDVLALTSHNEANPVSILEAMSVGKPVVATNVGSVAESVREGGTGFLVAAGDEAVFADRVLTLLHNPLVAKKYGAAGRRHVVEKASLEVMVGGYERLIAELYERKTGRKLPYSSPVSAEPVLVG
jgi:glycosyltransferase involved in cell wall biosynthesis